MRFFNNNKILQRFRGSFFGPSLLVAVLTSLFVASLISESVRARNPAEKAPAEKIDDDTLTALVKSLRKEKRLVGLAAMVMVDGEIVASAVDGERKKGSGVPLEIGDRWHIGSITKSITATMIARLVESGKMKWTDTIGDCFPDASIHDDWKPVTFNELLTHTSGAPPNFSFLVALRNPAPGPERTKARRTAVLNIFKRKPASPPGERRVYSNVGYTIAGAMAEEKTGVAWEDLVKREVFEPLKLTGAGFGPPKSSDKTLEQPRGHQSVSKWKVAADDKADNTSIIGPAGTVHMTLGDLCTYATSHWRGEAGVEDGGKFLSTETWKLLHKPVRDNYARGWVRVEPDAENPHTHYWHNGSNTMWYALVVFIPETKMVIAVTSNDGDIAKAEDVAWEIVEATVTPGKAKSDRTKREPSNLAQFTKKSPFTAVRWNDAQPEVKLGEEWLKLVSLNETPTDEIIAFSKRTYGNKYRKRFEEDLVELLTRMKQPPKDNVALVVESLISGEKSIRNDVPMTEANREAIKAAARDVANQKAAD